MKVKIGDKIYDSIEIPVVLIMDEYEKGLISEMGDDNSEFCSFPDNYTIEDIQEFMKVY